MVPTVLYCTQFSLIFCFFFSWPAFLHSPPSCFSLFRLQSLELRENLLKNLPNSFFSLTKLKVLDLGGNTIDELVSRRGPLLKMSVITFSTTHCFKLNLVNKLQNSILCAVAAAWLLYQPLSTKLLVEKAIFRLNLCSGVARVSGASGQNIHGALNLQKILTDKKVFSYFTHFIIHKPIKLPFIFCISNCIKGLHLIRNFFVGLQFGTSPRHPGAYPCPSITTQLNLDIQMVRSSYDED